MKLQVFLQKYFQIWDIVSVFMIIQQYHNESN